MARTKDRVVEEVKSVRRRLSARLWKAHQEGRLYEEMQAVEREGDRAYRDALKSPTPRRKRRKI